MGLCAASSGHSMMLTVATAGPGASAITKSNT